VCLCSALNLPIPRTLSVAISANHLTLF